MKKFKNMTLKEVFDLEAKHTAFVGHGEGREKADKLSSFKEELESLMLRHGAKLEWMQVKIDGKTVQYESGR